MAITTQPVATPAASFAAATVTDSRASYVDWPAILAGAIIASAVAFLLSAFGSALGLSLVSPYRTGGMPTMWVVIAIGLWILWVAGTSFMAGAYVTGRLRRRIGDATEHEVAVRDGLHGALVWAVATLIGAVLLVAGVSGAASIGARATGAAVGAAATTAAVSQNATGTQAENPLNSVADRVFTSADDFTKPGGDAARRTVVRIVGENALAGRKMAEADRTALARLVAARTGLDEAAATQRVDEAQKQADELAAKAKEAANVARKVGIVSAFLIAASLLIGFAGAYWAAGMGGRHRDEATVHAWMRWR